MRVVVRPQRVVFRLLDANHNTCRGILETLQEWGGCRTRSEIFGKVSINFNSIDTCLRELKELGLVREGTEHRRNGEFSCYAAV